MCVVNQSCLSISHSTGFCLSIHFKFCWVQVIANNLNGSLRQIQFVHSQTCTWICKWLGFLIYIKEFSTYTCTYIYCVNHGSQNPCVYIFIYVYSIERKGFILRNWLRRLRRMVSPKSEGWASRLEIWGKPML